MVFDYWKEKDPKPERSRTPEVSRTREIGKLLAEVFPNVSPATRKFCLESPTILALAGQKPMTLFQSIDFQSLSERGQVKSDIESLNAALDAIGCTILLNGEPRRFDEDDEDVYKQHVMVISRLGAERVTSKTTELDFPSMNSTGNYHSDLFSWQDGIQASVEGAKASGTIQKDLDTQIIVEGIALGYPLQAAIDFADWIAKDREPELVFGDMAYAREYSTASPEFDYYPEHKNDPSIKRAEIESSSILSAFYTSGFHRGLKQMLKD